MPTDLPAEDGRRFLTVEEAARWLNLSPKTVRRAMSAKELAYYRYGRAIRISLEDLEVYAKRHRN